MSRQLALAATLATLTLAGCGDVERTFGLVKDAPDEFTVQTQAPLSMPPSFQVPSPTPGADRPQNVRSDAAAEAAIAPSTALGGGTRNGPTTAGQQALMAEAGPEAPGGHTRASVNAEAKLDRPPQSLADRLMFWQSAPPPGTVMDPAAESQRLRQNAALGQPATTGATPIIQDKPKSSFLGVF